MKTKSGIYQILNIVNGKRYIGSAVNLRKRQNDHWSNLERGNHDNSYLQKAWNKYNKESFFFKIIEYVSNLGQLIKREQHYLDALNPEYNLSPTAGNILGYKHTPKTCKKYSKALIGNKHGLGNKSTLGYKHIPKTCEKHRGENNHFAKLTVAKIGKIHLLLAEGKTLIKIANMFKVDITTICKIRTGRTWKHVK